MKQHELDELEGRYVSVGDVVAGKYLVEKTLGQGGMAFVLSARHIDLDEQFALKFLNKGLLREEAVVERFMREARAACKIRSEYVARVHDVGKHDEAPFIVMEHLTGRDLATVVADDGPLAVGDAVEYIVQTCEALAAAHALGIVHRDIKPENLFLVVRDGVPSVKLLDFGISKTVLTGGEASSRLTGKLTLGTPCYMSPEQIRCSAAADAQSDLWSLGSVLYELLTGEQAFQAMTVTEVCARVLESAPTPIAELRPEVPAELCAVIATAMEKDRARRFANVGELAMVLLPFAPRRAQIAAERSSLTMRLSGAPESSGQFVSSHTPTSWTPTSELPELEVIGEGDPPPPVARPKAWVTRVPWAVAAAKVLVVIGVRTYPVGGAAVPRAEPPAVVVAAAPPPVEVRLPAPAEAKSAEVRIEKKSVRKASRPDAGNAPAETPSAAASITATALSGSPRVELGY